MRLVSTSSGHLIQRGTPISDVGLRESFATTCPGGAVVGESRDGGGDETVLVALRDHLLASTEPIGQERASIVYLVSGFGVEQVLKLGTDCDTHRSLHSYQSGWQQYE